MQAKVTVKGGPEAVARVKRLMAAMTPAAIDPVVDRAAWMVHARLVKKTPKRWFGQVRAGWQVAKTKLGSRLVINTNKIMLFLEEGTRDHGPKEIFGPLAPGQRRRKAALFIPLTRRAANATQGIYGVGHTAIASKTVQGPIKVRAIFQRTQRVRKGKTFSGSRALIFGQDYVLARRVRGIKAMHIIAKERPLARALVKRLMKAHIASAIGGTKNG